MFEKIDGVIFHRAIIERFDGDNGHLRAGLLFEFGAECFEALNGGLRNDSGEIGDIGGGRNLADVVAESGCSGEKQNRKSEKDGKTETRHERLEHNPLKPNEICNHLNKHRDFWTKVQASEMGNFGSIRSNGKRKDNEARRKDKCAALKTGHYKTGVNNCKKKQDR